MSAPSLTEQFLAEIEAFLSTTGTDPTSFGRAAVNDPTFVFRLRDGRSPRAKTIDVVRAYIAAETRHRLGGLKPQAAE
jgi:2,4-dienoyl-CoA reductase-like NADH-dependent reductase (Old Yellow Enzyme family)